MVWLRSAAPESDPVRKQAPQDLPVHDIRFRGTAPPFHYKRRCLCIPQRQWRRLPPALIPIDCEVRGDSRSAYRVGRPIHSRRSEFFDLILHDLAVHRHQFIASAKRCRYSQEAATWHSLTCPFQLGCRKIWRQKSCELRIFRLAGTPLSTLTVHVLSGRSGHLHYRQPFLLCRRLCFSTNSTTSSTRGMSIFSEFSFTRHKTSALMVA